MVTAIPTARQLEFQDWEFGLFVHLLAGPYRKWSGRAAGEAPLAAFFSPEELDCDQWARTAAAAGMRYMVLTVKHHEGFCLWPSALTREHSVAASPWRGGQGDIVAEYVEACRRHGLRAGLYYSPFDAHEPAYKTNFAAYDEYFIGHMRELLGNYGHIDILWFDGAFSEGHAYNWPRIIGEVRRLQPEILIFNMGDPDFRWVGNEAGIAPVPCWNVVDHVPFSIESDQEDRMPEPTWLPAECDCRIRYEGWTWRGADDPLKSVEELMGLYDYSVGRGCNLLLNVGPDRRGLIHEQDAARLLEFGGEIRRRFGSPLATLADCRLVDGHWTYDPGRPFLFDHVVVQEDLARGEHVRAFEIRIIPAPDGRPTTLHQGRSIGHKAICRVPLVKAMRVWLEITDSDGEAAIRELSIHNASGEA